MRFFITILFSVLFSAAFAQQAFYAGLLAGINGCQIHGDNTSGFNQVGAVAGAFVCTDPSQKAYGQMELQYSGKGSRKLANPDIGDYITFEIRMHYVEAAFLGRANYKRFYFELGETIGILGRVREWDVNGEITPTGYRRWETALIIGAGISLNDHLGIDFRYTNSLVPVKKFGSSASYPNFILNFFNKGYYNNVLGLSVFYRFGNSSGS
jgi:hypothetical protein